MCYLSTDREIADVPFDENDRKFNIKRIDETNRNYPACFTKRFVYYCGSSFGCGCGFGKMEITEELLQQTERELLAGGVSEKTGGDWWKQEHPPKDKSECDEIRASHRDNAALFGLITETLNYGYPCELLVCWADNEKNFPTETDDIDLSREPIVIDFRAAWNDSILLYRFCNP
ncbi:MAG: hypothetical protein LBU65_06535 [Planctomycetaceae bacterium]|jgi:hypothetical protein|nr:hypothetical protein [Planctomycetaceae bacterium]